MRKRMRREVKKMMDLEFSSILEEDEEEEFGSFESYEDAMSEFQAK